MRDTKYYSLMLLNTDPPNKPGYKSVGSRLKSLSKMLSPAISGRKRRHPSQRVYHSEES